MFGRRIPFRIVVACWLLKLVVIADVEDAFNDRTLVLAAYPSNFKRGAPGEMVIHSLDDTTESRWLQRNTTQFVRIVIPRSPSDKVFQMKK